MKKAILTILSFVIVFSFVLTGLAVKGETYAEPLTLSDDEKTALSLLDELKDDYGFTDAMDEFRLNNVIGVGYGKVFRLSQYHNGVKVYNRGINISADLGGNLLSESSSYLHIGDIRPERVTSDEAIAIAEALDLGKVNNVTKVIYASNEFKEYPTYAYYIELSGANVVISAEDGSVLENVTNTVAVQAQVTQKGDNGKDITFDVDKDNGTIVLRDQLRNIYAFDVSSIGLLSNFSQLANLEVKTTSETFEDTAAVTAYYNVVKSYDFYTDKNNTGDSMNGLGNKNDEVWGNNYNQNLPGAVTGSKADEMTIILLIHYGLGDYAENASYTSQNPTTGLFYIGDGNMYYKNLGSSLDIIGHEYTHGVTLSKVSNFGTQGEAGAIGESISDMFGMLIEDKGIANDDFWIIGEDSAKTRKWARNIIHPEDSGGVTLQGNMDKVDNKINFQAGYKCPEENHTHGDRCDNGGVHYNSTILTHMQYRIYKEMPEVFTEDTIGKLWYATMAMSEPDVTFKQFGEHMIKAAEDLKLSTEAVNCIKSNLYKSGILVGDDTTHLVTFVNPDNTLIDIITVKDGETVSAPPIGYTPAGFGKFLSWEGDLTNVTEDRTITAKYDIADFTVTFKDSDGTVLKTENVGYGKSATPPTVENKQDGMLDLIFSKWKGNYRNVTKNEEVVAEYVSVQCYNVTFKDGDQTIATVRTHAGEKPEMPANPTKEGYTFVCWYTDAALTTPFLPNQTISAETTLYAMWRAVAVTPGETPGGETSGDNPSENPGDNTGDDKDKNTGCACGTITFDNTMLPPAMLMLLGIGALILLPRRKDSKNK